jgi:hypothetical protein
MIEQLKNLARSLVSRLAPGLLARRQIRQWRAKGSPLPPPHAIKQQVIASYQQKYRHDILVETGTYMGDMVEAQKRRFRKIYSIELGEDLYNAAAQRFSRHSHITILHGDSGRVLPRVMKEITGPAIFWLDGHYSAGVTAKGEKDCPIYEELDAILAGEDKGHILLIDDARCFNGEGDYPTIAALTNYIHNKSKNYNVEVGDDVIRFVPGL